MSLHLFSHLRTTRAYRALAVTALLSGAFVALAASPAGAQPPTTISTALFDGTNVGPNLTDPPGTNVSDTATFGGETGAGATGSVTYSVYSDSACTVLVQPPDTENITTPGTLPPSATATLNTPGTYFVQASYSGDSNNAPSQTACGSETETIQTSSSTTTMTTTVNPYKFKEGQSTSDVAVVKGSASGPAPTGTVTFSLCGPLANESPPVPCTALTDESSGPISLTPIGSNTSKAVSPPFTPTSPGWWCFEDSYSGDSNYYSSSGPVGKGECADVAPLPGAVDYAGVALVTNGSNESPNVVPDNSTTYSAATTFTVPSVTCEKATSGMIDGTGVFSSVSNWVSAGGVVVECSGGVVTYSSQEIINNVMTSLPLTPAPGDTVSTDVEVTSTGGTGGSTSVTVDDPTQSYSNTTTQAGGMVGTYMSVGIDALRDYTTGDAYPPPSFGGLNFSNSTIDGKSLEAAGAKPISRVSSKGQLEIYTGPIDASGDGFGQVSEPAGTFTPAISAAPASSSVPEDTTNTVTATVTGNATSGPPTGNVSFTECGPLPSPKACSASADPLGSTVGVSAGSGDSSTATSAPLTPDAPGYWCIQSTYTGDSNYAISSDTSTDGCFKVTAVPLQITTTSLPDATIGVPYSATLQAIGGTPPYKWKVFSGTLPAGLTLNKTSGTISGTPSSTATTSNFIVKVKDSGAPAKKVKNSFTITVS
jgi:hypothetical protein